MRLALQEWLEGRSGLVEGLVVESELRLLNILRSQSCGDPRRLRGLVPGGRLFFNQQSPSLHLAGSISYLFPWAQPLDRTRKFVQSGVGALKQAVDDINNPCPVALYILDVTQGRTYVVRIRSRRPEKAARKREKPRILGVQGSAERGINGAVERQVLGGERSSAASGVDESGLDGGLEARKVVHDGHSV